jgi:hypothetical protein
MQQTLDEVAESVLTRSVVARVDECAPSTALLITAAFRGALTPASAVPLFGGGGASSSNYFLTSARVFNSSFIGQATVHYAGAAHPCELAATFHGGPSSLDLAIVYCAAAVAVPPSTLSAVAYQPHLPAAMLGFSEGIHGVPELCFASLVRNGSRVSLAPHVRFTRLASSLRAPSPPSGSNAALDGLTLRAASAPPSMPRESALGLMESSPEGGMSGGAVVDLRCGLLGIIKGESVQAVGGEMVRLTQPVVDRVLAAIAQFEEQLKGRHL